MSSFAAGVRYPAHLLHLVVATLSSIQTLMPPQQQLRQAGNITAGSGSTALQEQALKAAAMGAGGALRTEPVSPIDKKSLMKALRCASCTCAFEFCLNIVLVATTALAHLYSIMHEA